MKVNKIEESGYVTATTANMLPFNVSYEKAEQVNVKLAHKDGGHNKFLEFMHASFQVTAPRYWWQQYDSYRLGNHVHPSGSESTMHTGVKKPLEQSDFKYNIDERIMTVLNEYVDKKDLIKLKNAMPEGFLQTRVIQLNYKTIRNMILQRLDHRLEEWLQEFLLPVLAQLDHPELLPLLPGHVN
jgi:hypothetical protein